MMEWIVLAESINTGTIYPYGPFPSRDAAKEWAAGKFDTRYILTYTWLRHP